MRFLVFSFFFPELLAFLWYSDGGKQQKGILRRLHRQLQLISIFYFPPSESLKQAAKLKEYISQQVSSKIM